MPTLLMLGNRRFFFFSNERAEPAHVHVEVGGNGQGHAKFWLEGPGGVPYLASSNDIPKHELRKIRAEVAEHADLFKEKWNEYFAKKK